MSRLVGTLVYGDLRGAGHELLSRSDLDLRWALTLHEALAVSKRVKLDLVIASDHYALAYLSARAELPSHPPCIVLLGDHHLDEKAAFEEAGATALVSGSDPQRIVEAISELTGLTFRDHPRVPLHTVVDVQYGNDSHLLYTFDLSISGVCIRDLPEAKYGDRATVTFDLFDPPLTAEAMVVRSFNLPEAKCTGLAFVELKEEDRKRIEHLVAKELVSMPMFTTSDIADMPGEQTIDLLTALRNKSDEGLSEYLDMLTAIVHSKADAGPSWLFEVAAKLTETEREALRGKGPEWAKTAVSVRLDLKRQIIDRSSSGDFSSAMEFCSAMAGEVKSATVDQAVDATSIRSAILRAVYQLHQHMKEREAQAIRKDKKKKR
jgi:hypothetical protein